MVKIALFTAGFHTCQVLQDFFHQQHSASVRRCWMHSMHSLTFSLQCPSTHEVQSQLKPMFVRGVLLQIYIYIYNIINAYIYLRYNFAWNEWHTHTKVAPVSFVLDSKLIKCFIYWRCAGFASQSNYQEYWKHQSSNYSFLMLSIKGTINFHSILLPEKLQHK